MFYKAKAGKKNTVIYFQKDGKVVIYSSGTRSWRNNNPGNIIKSAFASRNGAIGEAGGFAIFSSFKDGRKAIAKLLKTRGYKSLTIEDAIKRYAPPHENNTKAYVKSVQKFTGIPATTKINKLGRNQFSKLVDGIIHHEGFKEGSIIKFKPDEVIKSIKDKNGNTTHYLVENRGEVKKAVAIALAEKHEIRAVIVRSRRGVFLRSYPDRFRINNLNS